MAPKSNIQISNVSSASQKRETWRKKRGVTQVKVKWWLPLPSSFRVGAALPPSASWVVLLGLLHLRGTVCLLLRVGVAAFLHLPLVVLASFSTFGWCCLPLHPLGGAVPSPVRGAAFSSSFFCVVRPSPASLEWCCRFPSFLI